MALKIARFFCLFLLTTSFSFGQAKPIANKEIKTLLKEATKLMQSGAYEKSLIKSRVGLKYAIASKNPALIGYSYNTIAANFDELAEFEKALIYYKKGLYYAEKSTDYALRNWLCNNLGNIYCFDKKEYTKGIYFYKKSLQYSAKSHDSTQLLFTKLNITWAYFDAKKYTEGVPYLHYINAYHAKHGDEATIVVLQMLNGMYHTHRNNFKKANAYFEKAIKMGDSLHFLSDVSYAHQEYARYFQKTKNYKNAYYHLNKFNEITNEINYQDNLKKVEVAGINLEIDEYKRTIEQIEIKLKSKQELIEEQQFKNRKISLFVASILMISVVLLFLFLRNYKLRQKNNFKNLQRQTQEKIMNATISGQEMERKKIAEFLHDSISALLSTAGMHLSVFSKINKDFYSEEIEKTKALLHQTHNKIRDLSHDLLPSVLTRFGLFYALNDLCEMNSNSEVKFSYLSGEAYEKRYNEAFELKVYAIVKELFNNVNKHSAASLTTLKIQEVGQNLEITVSDNGKGFDTSLLHFAQGFGLHQIKSRVRSDKGSFEIFSNHDKGTIVTISLPILL